MGNDNVSTISSSLIPPHPNYFPSDVLKWMKINASANMAVKLMNVCKYFQRKPFCVVVVRNIYWFFDKNAFDILINEDAVERRIIQNIKEPMWITQELYIGRRSGAIVTISSKIIIFDLKGLYIAERKISIKDFKFLAFGRKLTSIAFHQAAVIDKNGDKVTLQNILECTPKLESIST